MLPLLRVKPDDWSMGMWEQYLYAQRLEPLMRRGSITVNDRIARPLEIQMVVDGECMAEQRKRTDKDGLLAMRTRPKKRTITRKTRFKI